MSKSLVDLTELFELARTEDDETMIQEVAGEMAVVEQRVSELEFRRMFSGEMDSANAYLDIQAGSGGTEAQDWAEMLLRMYLRWGSTTASVLN